MLFADPALSREIEAAERTMMTGFIEAVRGRSGYERAVALPIGGGAATYAMPEAPFNKVIGLGLDGPVDEAELEAVERAFDERSAPVQIELATVAHNSVARLLTERGYRLLGFENVLALDLQAWAGRHAGRLPTSVRTGEDPVTVAAPEDGDADLWLDTVVDGFAHPDDQPTGESHESFPRETLARIMRDMAGIEGMQRQLARRGGVVAGGASLRIHGRVAQLCGAATLPQHRRRGVQSALLQARLTLATASACEVAIVTTAPASKSQQNAHAQGFELLYARAMLVRAVPAARPWRLPQPAGLSLAPRVTNGG